jgi:hypothetical protein
VTLPFSRLTVLQFPSLLCHCSINKTHNNPYTPTTLTIIMDSTKGNDRQSPPPETQSDRQTGQPASGQGTDKVSNKEQTNKSGLEVGCHLHFHPSPLHPHADQHGMQNLTSNPTGSMDKAVEEKFAKTQK